MNSKSLIVNTNMEIKINWELWSAEVDCLAKLIKGKKTKITEAEICDFLQGVLDGIIMESVDSYDKLEKSLMALRREGKTEDQIKSYIRGWNQVDQVLNTEQ